MCAMWVTSVIWPGVAERQTRSRKQKTCFLATARRHLHFHDPGDRVGLGAAGVHSGAIDLHLHEPFPWTRSLVADGVPLGSISNSLDRVGDGSVMSCYRAVRHRLRRHDADGSAGGTKVAAISLTSRHHGRAACR